METIVPERESGQWVRWYAKDIIETQKHIPRGIIPGLDIYNTYIFGFCYHIMCFVIYFIIITRFVFCFSLSVMCAFLARKGIQVTKVIGAVVSCGGQWFRFSWRSPSYSAVEIGTWLLLVLEIERHNSTI